ncbi:SIR2-like domain-containing protein [Chromohalobacter canadensis]|uniref:SIR2-like domain-containing protein n=1 Tax=Chromohalobacter canadensis TaxID=141389 RepID=A0A285VKN2_9GAMM|nr:SIR2 family protein [Chromohalobacter canadensis]SOC54619.1 SIR2-like domain-containing protein [Chromohalobacter canadensis]
MARKLIIFGNGLGMALDRAHFSLAAALEDIWNRPDFLTNQQKQLIERCLQRSGAPEGEHELDTLHQAVTYCKALGRIGEGEVHWLTEDGMNFPEITATYIHKVATKLHNYEGDLPGDFEESLVGFVKATRSHVATLNYDKLLYNSFIDNDIFNGYRGFLVDGMLDQGFSSEALERKYGKKFGYYLHLHGSPLFVDRHQEAVKLSRHQLTVDRDEASEHIVLTHIKRKPAVIAASHVLSTYWDYLQFALSESEEVILFGYSGLDAHLNLLLRPYLNLKALRVVEWSGAGDQRDRENYWRDIFGQAVQVTRLDNISEFTDW